MNKKTLTAAIAIAIAAQPAAHADDAEKIAGAWMSHPSADKSASYEEWLFAACEGLNWDMKRAPSCEYAKEKIRVNPETGLMEKRQPQPEE